MNVKLALLASGTGSNVMRFLAYFEQVPRVEIALVMSNKAEAPVVAKATKAGVETLVMRKEQASNGMWMVDALQGRGIDFVVLAGYLQLIPVEVIDAYRNYIVNIHPSLLPRHGGKGMYGHRVHRAVLQAREVFSGITIHHVGPDYDKGDVIMQASVEVRPDDTVETLAERVHELEYEHYPETVHRMLRLRFPEMVE
ncbi:MAG: phosphoribosylglycinamide formyltransferase [Bacteroidetes bacterium]|nr:phosphoribosylglycinamide formyltransferase [Bacteroidota bacterium]